jgi:hypothetical protein
MKIYKKWFLVDINDKSNPRSLFSFVDKHMKPKGKNPFYVLNGIRYNVISKSKWNYVKNTRWKYREIYVHRIDERLSKF